MPRSGTGRMYQRGDVWWIDYSHRGKRHRESTGSNRKGDAVALLRKRMAEMATGKVRGPAEERVTFEDLMELVLVDYQLQRRRSIRRLRGAIQHLAQTFAGSLALDITTDRIDAYVAGRQEEGAADSTIQKELAALRRAFTLARKAGRITNPPVVTSLSPDNVRGGFFEPGDLDQVLQELPEDLRPVVRFADLTGWRKGEILGLRWSLVDFHAGVIRLAPGTTKNREGRSFPFATYPELLELLTDQRERTRALEKEAGEIIPHVFHRSGREIRSMDGAWRAACRRAGLEGLLFHDLRRTAVRNMERAGVSRSVAMSLTGHKTESVYRRYAIVNEEVQREGVAKLSKSRSNRGDEAPSVVPLRKAQG